MTDEAKKNPQPLFYDNPIPLLKDRHADAGILQKDNFAFAQNTKTLPLNLPEFAECAKQYPIAFTSGDNPLPIAILAIGDNNLYVDSKGNWEEGVYIPAYARRYPFAFMKGEGDSQLLLCVDESAKRFVQKAKKDDARFFNDKGEQTAELKNILTFCEQFHNDNLSTVAFCKQLKDKGLLKERRITLNLGDKLPAAELHGFQTIDEDAFQKLDEKTLKEWHKNGLLGIVYFQIMSTGNWGNLVQRHLKNAKPASKANAKK